MQNYTKTKIGLIACMLLLLLALPVSAEVSGNYTYSLSDGCVTITKCDASVSGNIRLPDAIGGHPVTAIGARAFESCPNLIGITIPQSVTYIGEFAFELCSNLSEVNVSDNLINIGFSAFWDTAWLKAQPDGAVYLGKNVCDYKRKIKNEAVIIKDGTKSIGEKAFHYTSIASIDLPDSLTFIGKQAFSECSELSSIVIPSSVKTIGENVFEKCPKLTDINVLPENAYYSSENGILFDKNKTTLICCPPVKQGEFSVPKSVTRINSDAFSYCDRLTGITLPETVSYIGSGAFKYCSALKNINLPYGIDAINKNTFASCKALEKIDIPNNVKIIDTSAFLNCSALGSINIPESVTQIGNNAFYNCSSLQFAILPENLSTISARTFSNCKALTTINIPDGVTEIGEAAFFGCTVLNNVMIPVSVTAIGINAFANCTSITDIYYTGSYAEWLAISTDNTNTRIFNNALIHYDCLIPATYAVFYNANGGTNTPKAQKTLENSSITIQAAIPMRAGYAFLGWTSSPDAISAEYVPGDSIFVGRKSITLYAVWEKRPLTSTSVKIISKLPLFTVIPYNIPDGSTIILACYKGGALTDIQTAQSDGEAKQFISASEFDSVRIFVFDSLDTMIPLTNPENAAL